LPENSRFTPAPMGMVDEDDDDDILNGDDRIMASEDIDSPKPEDYLVTAGELEGEDVDAGLEDDGEPPAWYTSEQRIQELRNKHRRHDKDTGSPEFQVAGMTERIAYLTKHLQQHPKDFSTRRGLLAMVNKRRRLLNYLAGENEQRYVEIIASLGIRHKKPGEVANRDDAYSRFPRQKAVKKHLQTKYK
jgi:small subunit ribosomal protein S15